MTSNSDKHSDFLSYQQLQELMFKVLGLLSEHFKGETTINNLRIGNYIGLKSIYRHEPTNNKDISQALSIPSPTVTRIITTLIKQGYVVETNHPDDGRRRLVSIIANHPKEHGFETDLRQIVGDILQSYDQYKAD